MQFNDMILLCNGQQKGRKFSVCCKIPLLAVKVLPQSLNLFINYLFPLKRMTQRWVSNISSAGVNQSINQSISQFI